MTEEMSREFDRVLEPSSCRARVQVGRHQTGAVEWLDVLRQCGKVCVEGKDVCAQHLKKASEYGKVGERMLQSRYEQCVAERSLRAERPKSRVRAGQFWYTRHHMWGVAVNLKGPSLHALEELTEEERREALRKTHETIRDNANLQKQGHGDKAVARVVKGRGPQIPGGDHIWVHFGREILKKSMKK